MSYSCAYFKDSENSLEDAHCRKLRLQPGERLIDVGRGWGGMLIYAAQHYRVTGVGYTLSQNQLEYARDWGQRAGIADQVSFQLQDYREAV
jgi:cyclopropane-fatty-acyl-phospholipid synthase